MRIQGPAHTHHSSLRRIILISEYLPKVHMSVKRSLEGKVCLITGASRGLGRALALEFARQGAALVINSRPSSHKDLSQTETEIKELGAEALSVLADVSVRVDLERLAGEALARFQRVDVLVNNASALGPPPCPICSIIHSKISPQSCGPT